MSRRAGKGWEKAKKELNYSKNTKILQNPSCG